MEHTRYEEPAWLAREDPPRADSGVAVLWFLVGIGIGAGAALLFAPTSGHELRAAISHGLGRTVSGINHGTQQLRQRGSKLLNFNRRRSRERLREG